MSRPNPTLLTVSLAVLIALMGGAAVLKGGFYLTKHESDTLHLVQIVFRMVDGEWPHLDFMTPIGWLAFAPIALLVKLGAGMGHAIIFSQILVALVLLPALVWTGATRFEGRLAYVFGGLVLLLTLALVYGEAERAVSISMHYNRWAWAITYPAIVLALLPPRTEGDQTVDGAIIGLSMAALALCKVTYFVAFAPPVVIALLMRGAFRTLIRAISTGLIVVALLTLAAGAEFWRAYLQDLLAVSRSEVRPQPGEPLVVLLSAPEYLATTLALLAGVILLRQAGAQLAGLVLLLLAPGFYYVTFQNFGNDPQWLPLVGVLLLAYRPRQELRNAFGWNLRSAMTAAALAVFALAAPSLFNLGYSPFRHLTVDDEEYTPLLTRFEAHSDLKSRAIRANRVDGRIALDGPGSGLENRAELAERPATRTELAGEELPECELQLGLTAWYETIVADIEAAGLAGGKRVFAADVVSGHWLFGDLRRLTGGAPWYYGGLPGIESADYLLVPLCPMDVSARKLVLRELGAREVALREIRRTPLYLLFEIVRG